MKHADQLVDDREAGRADRLWTRDGDDDVIASTPLDTTVRFDIAAEAVRRSRVASPTPPAQASQPESCEGSSRYGLSLVDRSPKSEVARVRMRHNDLVERSMRVVAGQIDLMRLSGCGSPKAAYDGNQDTDPQGLTPIRHRNPSLGRYQGESRSADRAKSSYSRFASPLRLRVVVFPHLSWRFVSRLSQLVVLPEHALLLYICPRAVSRFRPGGRRPSADRVRWGHNQAARDRADGRRLRLHQHSLSADRRPMPVGRPGKGRQLIGLPLHGPGWCLHRARANHERSRPARDRLHRHAQERHLTIADSCITRVALCGGMVTALRPIEVRTAAADAVPKVAAALADAFIDDPVFTWLRQAVCGRRRGYERCLRLRWSST